jgi:hypothetical protein
VDQQEIAANNAASDSKKKKIKKALPIIFTIVAPIMSASTGKQQMTIQLV